MDWLWFNNPKPKVKHIFDNKKFTAQTLNSEKMNSFYILSQQKRNQRGAISKSQDPALSSAERKSKVGRRMHVGRGRTSRVSVQSFFRSFRALRLRFFEPFYFQLLSYRGQHLSRACLDDVGTAARARLVQRAHGWGAVFHQDLPARKDTWVFSHCAFTGTSIGDSLLLNCGFCGTDLTCCRVVKVAVKAAREYNS